MYYYYKVFGLNCASEIELPAFLSIPKPHILDFHVRWSKEELPNFESPPSVCETFFSYNETEFKGYFPEIAYYFIKDGKNIWIKPLSSDWDSILLFLYSNAIAALLLQKNLIPFHVSGVLDSQGGVWLFSALSQTGKSTTALMLKELGYQLFTDDTCLISIKDEKVYAVPSYPMIRVWKPTLNQYQDQCKDTFQIRKDVEKFGIYYHEKFISEPTLVKGIIFLQLKGNEISIETQTASTGMVALSYNIYRRQWIKGMKKQLLEFDLVREIAQKTLFFKATRPKSKPSFKEFAQAIHTQILSKNM